MVSKAVSSGISAGSSAVGATSKLLLNNNTYYLRFFA